MVEFLNEFSRAYTPSGETDSAVAEEHVVKVGDDEFNCLSLLGDGFVQNMKEGHVILQKLQKEARAPDSMRPTLQAVLKCVQNVIEEFWVLRTTLMRFVNSVEKHMGSQDNDIVAVSGECMTLRAHLAEIQREAEHRAAEFLEKEKKWNTSTSSLKVENGELAGRVQALEAKGEAATLRIEGFEKKEKKWAANVNELQAKEREASVCIKGLTDELEGCRASYAVLEDEHNKCADRVIQLNSEIATCKRKQAEATEGLHAEWDGRLKDCLRKHEEREGELKRALDEATNSAAEDLAKARTEASDEAYKVQEAMRELKRAQEASQVEVQREVDIRKAKEEEWDKERKALEEKLEGMEQNVKSDAVELKRKAKRVQEELERTKVSLMRARQDVRESTDRTHKVTMELREMGPIREELEATRKENADLKERITNNADEASKVVQMQLQHRNGDEGCEVEVQTGRAREVRSGRKRRSGVNKTNENKAKRARVKSARGRASTTVGVAERVRSKSREGAVEENNGRYGGAADEVDDQDWLVEDDSKVYSNQES